MTQIAKNMTCTPSKGNAIAINVLKSYSIEHHIKYLVKNNKKFSISNDAFNKGNRKMFLISIQYFHLDDGIVNFLWIL